MRRRSAAPDLHDDLQSCDRRTARELQLAADCMLGSGGDVSDPRRRGPDQAVVGHHEVDEHVYVERVLLLRFVAEDDPVAHSRAAVGIGPRRPAGLDDRDVRGNDLADDGEPLGRAAGTPAPSGYARGTRLHLPRYLPGPRGMGCVRNHDRQPGLLRATLVADRQGTPDARGSHGDCHGRLIALDDARVSRDELDPGRAAARGSRECTHDDERHEGEREETLGCGGCGHSSGRLPRACLYLASLPLSPDPRSRDQPRARADLAARWPHIPCTPPPGGVDAEHR